MVGTLMSRQPAASAVHLTSGTLNMPIRPVHPGEILGEELAELGISPSELARQIKVPPNRISQILRGQRSITGDTAVRLAHWFNMSAEFWMGLQAHHDVALARQRLDPDVAGLQRRTA